MQICLLTEKVKHPGFVPDCRLHKHLSRGDALQAAADGKVTFVSPRAVVAVGSVPLSGYWYDDAVRRSDRYLGTAKSGPVRTRQLVTFMPRKVKHTVSDIGACGAHGRSMTAKTVNAVSPATNRVRDQE
jgi:hypothetical protein